MSNTTPFSNVIKDTTSVNTKPWDDNPDMVLNLDEYTREELKIMLEESYDESEYLHEQVVELEKQIAILEELLISRESEIMQVLRRNPLPYFRKKFGLDLTELEFRHSKK